VITADDVSRIAIFAELSEDDRAQLARAAADIALAPGEFAAEQGSERALFGLIEGCIEAVQTVDGVERIVGRREPGDIFGEVPITLGTVFPVGFRACEESRVMRIEPRNYHSVASTAPDVALEVGRLAGHRMSGPGGLQGLASDPVPPRAIVVGERTDAECTEVRHFLDRNQVVFEWLTSETPNIEERWDGPGPVPAPEDQPAVRVIGGKMVIRPQLRRLAELLGLGTEPESATYDVVIVGAGPAGLAAGVYGASEGLSTIVVERAAPGGQAGTSSRIENYLGFPAGVSGDELAGRALQQARRLGAEILVTRTISRIDADRHQLHLDGGDVLHGRTIVLACGVSWRNLDVPGFPELTGRGVYYGASPSDAAATHGQDVHVIGAGNSGGQAAMFFSNHARSVTIVCRGESLEKSMSSYLIRQLATRANVNVRLRSEIVAAHGDDALEEVEIVDHSSGTVEREASGGVYIFIGADAETGWLPPEIALDQRGFILTGADVPTAEWARERDPFLLETSVPGVFACGDVRSGPVKRVAAAVGEGSMAIAFIHQYLRDEQRAAAPA
jgi:thioredoxin reductase (NADPH)